MVALQTSQAQDQLVCNDFSRDKYLQRCVWSDHILSISSIDGVLREDLLPRMLLARHQLDFWFYKNWSASHKVILSNGQARTIRFQKKKPPHLMENFSNGFMAMVLRCVSHKKHFSTHTHWRVFGGLVVFVAQTR